MTDHEKAAMEAAIRAIGFPLQKSDLPGFWQAARAYVPPATEPVSKPSWADVQAGDRVTYHNMSNFLQEPFVTALQTRAVNPRHVVLGDREMPIIRIERLEYRDVTPQAEPQARMKANAQTPEDPYHGRKHDERNSCFLGRLKWHCQPVVPEPPASDKATR